MTPELITRLKVVCKQIEKRREAIAKILRSIESRKPPQWGGESLSSACEDAQTLLVALLAEQSDLEILLTTTVAELGDVGAAIIATEEVIATECS